MLNPICSIALNLHQRSLTIMYFHPADPAEELCFKIEKEQFNLLVLQDFLSACSPLFQFGTLQEKKARQFCQIIYKKAVRASLKSWTDAVLQKVATGLIYDS